MSLKIKVIRALSWTAFTQIFNVGLGLVVSIILARILSPQDFGVVAIAAGIMAVCIGLADFGFTALIIRSTDMKPVQLRELFTLRVLLSLAQCILLWLLAEPLAAYFGHPELRPLIKAFSFVVLLTAFSMVPDALLRKQLEFRKLAIVNTVSACAAGAVGVTLALNDFGYWSLVAQYLVSALCAALLLLKMCKWRPGFASGVTVLHANRSYIFNTYGLNMMGALVLQGDKLLLGKLLGATTLGLYMRGFGLSQQLQGFAMTIAEQVAFPALAESKDNLQQACFRFLGIVRVVYCLILPGMALLAVIAQPLVLWLYGEQWLASAPIMQVLLLGLAVNAINLPWDWLIRVTGHMHVLFRWSLLDGPTRLAALVIGIHYGGALGAAWGFLLAALLWFVARSWIMSRVVGIKPAEFLAMLPRSAFIATLTAATAAVAMHFVAGTDPWLQLLVAGTAGAVCYVAAVSLIFGRNFIAGLRTL